jgi:hypothetical protein
MRESIATSSNTVQETASQFEIRCARQVAGFVENDQPVPLHCEHPDRPSCTLSDSGMNVGTKSELVATRFQRYTSIS